jgi:hypothetical protein
MHTQHHAGADVGYTWENEPRGGWEAFQAARDRQMLRMADQSFGLLDRPAPNPIDWSAIQGLDGEG